MAVQQPVEVVPVQFDQVRIKRIDDLQFLVTYLLNGVPMIEAPVGPVAPGDEITLRAKGTVNLPLTS